MSPSIQCDQREDQLLPDVRVAPARRGAHVKGMIGFLQEFQRGPRAEALHDRLQQFEARELVARALQEQHRNLDVRQVVGAILRGTSRGMQWECEKRQARDAGQRRERLRLRSHATTERSAAGDQRETWRRASSFRDCGAHRGVTQRRRIGPP